MSYNIDSNWINNGTKLVPKESQKVDVSNGITSYYNTAVDQLTDGSFELWVITGYTPDDFGSDNALNATPAERSTDSHAGTYAMLLNCDGAFGGNYISDTWINMAAMAVGDETLQIRFYGKRGTGTGNAALMYNCVDGEDNYIWNFTGASAGTWTILVGPPSADQIETLTLTSSYTQVTSTQVTIPSGYTEGMCILFGLSANTGDTILVDDYELLIASSDVATNGTFEAWTAVEGLTNWTIGRFSGSETSVVKESSAVYSGTYAVKMTDRHNNSNYVSQLITGTPAETLTARHYARGAAGNAGTVYSVMFFLNNTMGSADQVWNKTTTSWEAYTDFGSLDDDNRIFLEVSVSEVYTPSQTVLTIPASTKVQMIIFQSATDSDDLMYVDLASETKLTLGYGDLMTVDANGKTTFDGEIVGSDATGDTGLVNLGQLKETGLVLLGSQEVDMTSIAATTIHTASANELPVLISHVCTSVDAYSNPPTFSIGTNSTDYNNLVASGGATASVGTYTWNTLLGTTTAYPTLASSDAVKVNVTTGSTATTHDVTFYVFGVLI